MKLQSAQEAGKFITSRTVYTPCKRTLFHEVTKLIKAQALYFFFLIALFFRIVNEICPSFMILRTVEW
jgi:hypothetical protein